MSDLIERPRLARIDPGLYLAANGQQITQSELKLALNLIIAARIRTKQAQFEVCSGFYTEPQGRNVHIHTNFVRFARRSGPCRRRTGLP